MSDIPQYKYRTTELDPQLLSVPFSIQTNWHVITGAPCTGKTTLIDRLAAHGYQTAIETARLYFNKEMAKSRTRDEILGDGLDLQLGIFQLQLDLENGLQACDHIFLDRALPDSLTFHRVFGYDPDEILADCLHFHYASVFILDRLSLQREEPLGPEDEKSARYLDLWLERDYRSLGYDVVRVPVLSPEARTALVLEMLAKQRLI